MAAKQRQTTREDKPKRIARGFFHAARPLEKLIGKAAAKRGFAERRLLTAWDAVVGAELARLCRPARIVWGRRDEPGGAAIVVEASGAAAPEVEHLGPVLIEKVNAALGWRAVARLRVVQTGGFTPPAALAEAPAPYVAPPAPLDRRIEDHISLATDPGLREKLARLARNHAARRAAARKETP